MTANLTRVAVPVSSLLALVLFAATAAAADANVKAPPAARRPNVLLAVADDLSWPHLSAYGCRAVNTPAFDRVAREGVLFRNGFAGSPGCSPSRAALLTGKHHWQLGAAGTHASDFPAEHVVYPDALEQAGYAVGTTGKGWGPGNFKASGRTRNPAGPAFTARKEKPANGGIGGNDYAGNFADFLATRPKDAPFCFWYGATEPHRAYERGAGERAGKKPADVEVPPFLPDAPAVRGDLLDYLLEVEHFDRHLGRMLDHLATAGELEHTVVIVTADNGMAFPAAKANCYEYGVHVPLAVRWGAGATGGRTVDDVVGFVDLTATIYEAAGVRPPHGLVGKSLVPLLASGRQGVVEPGRVAFAGRERHSSSRHDNLGYPQRCVRTDRYLYVRNFASDRWPAGDPQAVAADGRPGTMHGAYHDIDAGPTLSYVVEHRDEPAVAALFRHAVAKRPAEELFDVRTDPGCLTNLAADPAHAEARRELAARLDGELRATGEPRVVGDAGAWDAHERYSASRAFPAPAAAR